MSPREETDGERRRACRRKRDEEYQELLERLNGIAADGQHAGGNGFDVKLPWGWVRARGATTALLVLVLAAMTALGYWLYRHDQTTKEIAEAMDEQAYILSLDQDQRRALNLEMPATLRKKVRQGRGEER